MRGTSHGPVSVTSRSSDYRAMRRQLKSCQLKSCQLPRNSAKTTCTTSPKQIQVMKLVVQMQKMGWLGGTQGHGQCHHSIERIQLPIRF